MTKESSGAAGAAPRRAGRNRFVTLVFWLMISEIFPLAHRSRTMALCTIFSWAANFIVSYFFLQEIGLIGQSATFWIYAVVGVLATGFIWLRVPETKNKPLEQIEQDVRGYPQQEAA